MVSTKEAAESAQQARKLLRNASANISRERRQKATQHLNLELAILVDDEESFKDAAPCSLVKHLPKNKGSRQHHKISEKPHPFQETSLFRGATPGRWQQRGIKKPGNFQTRRKTQ